MYKTHLSLFNKASFNRMTRNCMLLVDNKLNLIKCVGMKYFTRQWYYFNVYVESHLLQTQGTLLSVVT